MWIYGLAWLVIYQRTPIIHSLFSLPPKNRLKLNRVWRKSYFCTPARLLLFMKIVLCLPKNVHFIAKLNQTLMKMIIINLKQSITRKWNSKNLSKNINFYRNFIKNYTEISIIYEIERKLIIPRQNTFWIKILRNQIFHLL